MLVMGRGGVLGGTGVAARGVGVTAGGTGVASATGADGTAVGTVPFPSLEVLRSSSLADCLSSRFSSF